MGDIARTWQGLLQRVVEANSDIVSIKRLKGHLDRLAEKYPALEKVSVSEGQVSFQEDFPEDEGGLVTVCTVLGALYWTLDMFTGPTTAAERIRRPVREYIEGSLPPGTVIGLNRFLPKLRLERPAEGEPPEEGAEVARVPGTGARGDEGQTQPHGPGTRAPGPETREPGGGEGGGTEAAEFPGEEIAAQFPGTVPWLAEGIPRGCSLLVEGPGEAKERCSLRFIGEGLESGESVLALIAYSPEEFRKRLTAEGMDTGKAEEEGRLKILDWATFRERHVRDLEDEGPVMRLPMELPWVGSAINLALADLPETGASRAFVNILPRALATVAIETVFNFVQVTILKFKRKKMTGLFIMEEEKDPEKAAIRLSFNSWVEIQEPAGGGGRLSVRLGGPILRSKLKVMSLADGKWVVEKEEAIPPERTEGPEPPFMGELRQKLSEWRSLGYRVSVLEEALKGSPKRAPKTFERFGEDVQRLRTIRNDLKIMDLAGYEEEAARILEMVTDIEQVEQVERAFQQLRRKMDKKKAQAAAARERPGAEPRGEAKERPEAGPGAKVTEGPGAESMAAPGEEPAGESAAVREAPGAGGREMAKKELRPEEVEAVPEENVEVIPPEEIEAEIKEIEEALEEGGPRTGEGPALEAGKVAGERRGEGKAEEPIGPAAPPAAEGQKRREFREALEKWRGEGLSVRPLEEIMDLDLERVRRDFLLFRVQLQRLRELGQELAAIDAPRLAERREKLEQMLNDVARIPEIEKGLEGLRGELARLMEEERLRKEEEQRRRAKLSEKLFWWSSHGLLTERLEKLLDGELEQAEREFAVFEPGAQRLLELKEELSSLDTSEFKEPAAKLEARLNDVDRIEQAEQEYAAFKEFLQKQSREDRERQRLGEQLEAWRAKGIRVEHLDGLLGRDVETVRREFEWFAVKVEGTEELSAQLAGLDLTGFEKQAAELRERLKDPARLEECSSGLHRLRLDIERARAEERERAEYRARVMEWKKSGLQTRELESLLEKDLLSLRRAVVDFQFELDIYDGLVQLLEPLMQTKYAGEAEALRKEMKDFSKLPALEENVAALRARLEGEALASGKELSGEFERDLALVEKLRGWVDSGYLLRRLEGVLKGDRQQLLAEADRLEKEIEQLSKLASAIEVLDTKGLDRELAHIRTMLNDPEKLPAVKALLESLRGEIGRRKREEERRAALRNVVKEWEQKGYRVRHLQELLELDLEKASQDFILFHTKLSAAEHLKKRLDLLELFGMESEVERLRRRLREVDALEEVRREADELWKNVEERGRERTARRKSALERKRALKDRLVRWLEQGLSVRALENALQLSPDEAEAEFGRFEEGVKRLRDLGQKLNALEAPGFESELLAIRSKLNDVGSIGEAERALESLKGKVEMARKEQERLREQEKSRRAEEERRAALRKRLEERLAEWSGLGLNVDALRTALATELSLAERRFAEFEDSLCRTEELKSEIQELRAKGLADPAGAETIERMLQDPLKLAQARRAFAEFKRQAEAALRAEETELQECSRRIQELKAKGEEVSALEAALEKGLPEVRRAFEEHEQRRRRRDLEDTWKGIKSKVLSKPAAGNGEAGNDGETAEGRVAKKRVKKVKK